MEHGRHTMLRVLTVVAFVAVGCEASSTRTGTADAAAGDGQSSDASGGGTGQADAGVQTGGEACWIQDGAQKCKTLGPAQAFVESVCMTFEKNGAEDRCRIEKFSELGPANDPNTGKCTGEPLNWPDRCTRGICYSKDTDTPAGTFSGCNDDIACVDGFYCKLMVAP